MEGNKVEQSLKGTNWACTTLTDKYISADVDNKNLFKIPYKNILSSSVINRNELVLEFPIDDQKKDEDMLCEMRFYIPNSNVNENKEKKDQSKKDDGASGESEAEENVLTSAEKLNTDIMDKAKIGEFSGESILTFPEIPLVVPRGKYDADFYKECVRFHGNTFNYKIDYKNIDKAFLLPKPDDVHMVFVLSLKSPLRQGNTVYPYIVIQFRKEFETEIKIKLKPEQIKENYGDSLLEEYSGAAYDVFTQIFKIIVKIGIIIPGGFLRGIRCTVKAHEGFLFLLQKSLLFINKPVIYIKFEEIAQAEFHRTGSSIQSKLFDLEIKKKKGGSQLFVGIEKTEQEPLFTFLKSRKVRVELVEDKMGKIDVGDFDDEDDMEDEREGEKLGKRKIRPVKGTPEPDYNDEDDEDDEDFQIDEDDEDSDDDEIDEDDDEEDNVEQKQKEKSKANNNKKKK